MRLKRTKTKKRKVSVTFRKAVHLGKNSRIRVTARKAGYRSRYIRYRFVLRKKIGLDASRVGSGCQTPTKPVRNVTCSG